VDPVEITLLLDQVRDGNEAALDQLTRAIHGTLHAMAHSKLRRERPDHTLHTTALVNEAVIRLLRGKVIERSPNGRYLMAAAARAMCSLLVDHARRRRAAARAGLENRVPLDEVIERMKRQGLPILELNQALEELERCNPRQAKVIHLRYFAGRSIKEVSELLGVSEWTVENDFRIARAWLRVRLEETN
jgi:RNA polymerase sigma factor (TIGR02999 family)